MFCDYYESPIGILCLTANDDALTGVNFVENEEKPSNPSSITCNTAKQLDEYFAGNRKNFDLPLSLNGTDFQTKIWKNLRNISYGKTASYKDVAINIGNPKACRAVGGANNKNPIVIIVPCHRVIGANGKMVGYDCGIDKKIWLLEHEKKAAA